MLHAPRHIFNTASIVAANYRHVHTECRLGTEGAHYLGIEVVGQTAGGLGGLAPIVRKDVYAHEQVLGKSLVYEGAHLHLDRKADFVAKKQKDREAKAAAREVSVSLSVRCSSPDWCLFVPVLKCSSTAPHFPGSSSSSLFRAPPCTWNAKQTLLPKSTTIVQQNQPTGRSVSLNVFFADYLVGCTVPFSQNYQLCWLRSVVSENSNFAAAAYLFPGFPCSFLVFLVFLLQRCR